jgi:hypothetical protein
LLMPVGSSSSSATTASIMHKLKSHFFMGHSKYLVNGVRNCETIKWTI